MNPNQTPTSMQLICRGICDVIWLNSVRGPVVNYDALEYKTENPLTKFDDEIHDMIEDLHSQRAQFKATSTLETSFSGNGFKNILTQQGFRVQRLIKGDAITVRGLSPAGSYSHMSSHNQIYIVAGSSNVTTFELEMSKVKYLPPEIRVTSFDRRDLSVSAAAPTSTTTCQSRASTKQASSNGSRTK